MIDHVGFAISDYERGKAFYGAALAPLGYTLIMEVEAHQNQSGYPAAGYGVGGKPDFWIGGEGKLEKPLHVAHLIPVELAVSDAGPGMSPEQRARGFDRFWRPSGADRDGGSGLGLAIVQRLVTADGGSVALDESAEGGLVARVALRTVEAR